MENYLIIRHGSNAANQERCQRAVVAVVEQVENIPEALAKASEYLFCYPGQRLEAIVMSRASARDIRDAEELSILETISCDLCGKILKLERWKIADVNICDICKEVQRG